jgi:hypothetical protein
MSEKRAVRQMVRYRVWQVDRDGLMCPLHYAGYVETEKAPTMAAWWLGQLKASYVQLWAEGFCVASAKNGTGNF